jgi:ureidoglycolate lyase
MLSNMIIRPEPLTKDVFLPFGDVLETEGIDPQLINFGKTQKFGNLAEVTHGDSGFAQLSIYRSSAVDLPFRIRLMECHPLGSQAFYPLHHRPFPVVVAKPGDAPGAADIRVFLSNGRQGVNLHAGVWHHYQLTLGQDSDYLVVDRGGKGDNCREHHLSEEVWVDL